MSHERPSPVDGARPLADESPPRAASDGPISLPDDSTPPPTMIMANEPTEVCSLHDKGINCVASAQCVTMLVSCTNKRTDPCHLLVYDRVRGNHCFRKKAGPFRWLRPLRRKHAKSPASTSLQRRWRYLQPRTAPHPSVYLQSHCHSQEIQ